MDSTAIHPGEFLAEILTDLGISQGRFAKAAGVSAMRVSHLIKGQRPVTGELALRLGKVLGQSPQYWLNLQASYDLRRAREAVGDKLNALHILPQLAAA
jgi:antitoxin HigA-1